MTRRILRKRSWRSVALERLEPRWVMDGAACQLADVEKVEAPADQPAVVLLQADTPSSNIEGSAHVSSDLTPLRRLLDINRDGRVSRAELLFWLAQWRRQSQRPQQPADPPPASDTTSEPAAEAPASVELPPADSEPPPLADVPYYGAARDWGLNASGAPESWSAGHSGQGVTVAVIDTGADLDHSELADALWTNPDEVPNNGRDDDHNGYVDDVHGWDFVHRDGNPHDQNGHGTHVASVIVGARDGVGSTGVAYGAELMVLQGLGADGVGSTRQLAEAVRYAVDNGADIINMSLGGAASTALRAAIAYAAEHDVLVVAAAGNDGADQPDSPAALSAQMENVVSVGAVDRSGETASFSNQVGSSRAVQLLAPGVRIYGAVPGGYAYYTGTSMATPHVAGVAALALSARPELSAAQLRDLLVQGVEASPPGDNTAGVLNAATTVAYATQSMAAADTSPAAVRGPSVADTLASAAASADSSQARSDDALPAATPSPLEAWRAASRWRLQRAEQVDVVMAELG